MFWYNPSVKSNPILSNMFVYISYSLHFKASKNTPCWYDLVLGVDFTPSILKCHGNKRLVNKIRHGNKNINGICGKTFMFDSSSLFCLIYTQSSNIIIIINTDAIVWNGVFYHSGTPYLIPPLEFFSVSALVEVFPFLLLGLLKINIFLFPSLTLSLEFPFVLLIVNPLTNVSLLALLLISTSSGASTCYWTRTLIDIVTLFFYAIYFTDTVGFLSLIIPLSDLGKVISVWIPQRQVYEDTPWGIKIFGSTLLSTWNLYTGYAWNWSKPRQTHATESNILFIPT